MTRKQWDYTDENGVAQSEDISIYHKGSQADGQPASKKIHPNSEHPSNPLTDGWNDERPTGPDFTFQFARLGAMLMEIEQKGIAEWSALTNYNVPAMVWGSDGQLYIALQASGPPGDAKDPVSEPTYWQNFLPFQGLQSVQFEQREDQNVGGGSMINDTATVRPINHINHNDIGSGVSVNDFDIVQKGGGALENTFKPAIGTYEIDGRYQHCECGGVRDWFENYDTGVEIVLSDSMRTSTVGDFVSIPLKIQDRIYFNGVTRCQIIGMADLGSQGGGFAMGNPVNQPAGSGYKEIYMKTKMTRISLLDITS